MNYQIITLVILASFYAFYLAKFIIQKRQSIKTNQMGVGNKSRKVLIIERITSGATVLTIVVELGSIVMVREFLVKELRIIGIIIGIMAVILFAAATITMKNNWRVGIPEEKTSLVTEGIYKWSRNPAFAGFDLLYLSMCLLYFNIPLLIISILAAVMLHMQILQEEVHMENMFGEEYVTYKKQTMRYFGKRNINKK